MSARRTRAGLAFLLLILLWLATACSSSKGKPVTYGLSHPQAESEGAEWAQLELAEGISLSYTGDAEIEFALGNMDSGGLVVTVTSSLDQDVSHFEAELFFNPAEYSAVSADFLGSLYDAEVRLAVLDVPGRIAAGAAFKGLAARSFARGEEMLRFELSREPTRGIRQAVEHVPEGVENRPLSLNAVYLSDPPSLFITWNQRVLGDYSQDGEVTIADVAPVALYYQVSTGSILDIVDGDGSGDITIADVAPIARNYLAKLTGFNVYLGYKADGESEYTYAQVSEGSPDIPLHAPESPDRLTSYSTFADLGEYGDYSVKIVPVGPGGVEAGSAAHALKLYSYVPPPPPKVPNQRVSEVTRDHVTVAWDEVTSELVGEVLCYKSTTGGINLDDYELDATYAPTFPVEHTFSDLTPVTDYYFLILSRSTNEILSEYTLGDVLSAYTAVQPVAAFTGPDTFLNHDTRPGAGLFDAGGSYDPDGTVASYHWDWGDGTEGDVIGDPVAYHTDWQADGELTVTLTVVDNDGAESEPQTHNITVIQGRTDILLVFNTVFEGSEDIAWYYADPVTGRGIDPLNIAGFTWDDPVEDNLEIVRRDYFEDTMKTELEDHLVNTGFKDTIKYIVPTKGVPLKIRNSAGSGTDRNAASVDSDLCFLFQEYDLASWKTNPFHRAISFGEDFQPFFHSFGGLEISYLVSRLDAYTVEEVYGMIDRSKLAPGGAEGGYVIVDDQPKGSEYDFMHSPVSPFTPRDTESLVEVLLRLGTNHIEDNTPAMFIMRSTIGNDTACDNVFGYVSHGIHSSSDPGNQYILTGLDFIYRPGAFFSTYESFNAWSFNGPESRNGQGMIGDFFRMGGTCAVGNVWEPYGQLVVQENIFFDEYLTGRNFIESAYKALPGMSWQEVVVGDPLTTIVP